MAINIIENLLTPEVPKMLDNEQLHVYVPNASYENAGIAKYDVDDFIIVNNKVSVKTATNTIRGLASFGLEFTVVNGHVRLSTLFYQDIDDIVDDIVDDHNDLAGAHVTAFNKHNTVVGKHTQDHANTLQSAKDYADSAAGDLDTTLREEIDYVHQDALGALAEHKASSTDHSDIRTAITDLGTAQTNALNAHNTSPTSHTNLLNRLSAVEAVASGKSSVWIFDNSTDLFNFLADTGEARDSYNYDHSKWKSGDRILVVGGLEYTEGDEEPTGLGAEYWYREAFDPAQRLDAFGNDLRLFEPYEYNTYIGYLEPIHTSDILQILDLSLQASASADLAEGYAQDAFGYRNTAKEHRDEALTYRNWSENFSNVSRQYADGKLITGVVVPEFENLNAKYYRDEAQAIAEQMAIDTSTITADIGTLQGEMTTAQVDITTTKKQVQDLTQTIQQSNLSGEDKISTEGYGTLSLPKNATGYCGVELNGNTLRNLVVNGDFSNGTIRWTGYGSTLSIENGKLKVTSTGVYSYAQAYQSITTVIGNKYFWKFENTNGTKSLNLLPPSGVEAGKSTIYTATATTTLVKVSLTGEIQDYAYADDFIVVDLTAHGLDTLTVEQCDLMTDLYFNGTQSAMVSRVTSVGKNLFDLKQVKPRNSNSIISINGNSITITDAYYCSITINVIPNTDYYFSAIRSVDGAGAATVFGTSANNQTIKSLGRNNGTFNTGSYTKIVIALYSGSGTVNTATFSNVQLEEGTVATPYEPYRKQDQYIKPYPLYRLPNGTCNDIVSGKYTGRVKKYLLTADDVLDIYTENEDLEVISVGKPTDYIGYNNLLYPTAFKLDGYISTIDTSTSVGLIGTNWNWVQFGVSMAKGTTLEQAKTALTGVALYYELAEQYYTIENNIATGLLNANPNGTIYFDNGFADAGIYNDGITILNQDYPIEELETLLILNNDGSHTDLDVSTATIALDGKSFTHAGLTNGDIIAFTYKGADSPLKGLNKITYLDSKNTIADTENGKFYKYKPVITNGVIASWAVEEV